MGKPSVSNRTAEALWYVGPGQVEIREEQVGEPRAGEVRVCAIYSAVSRGTERLIFRGVVPPSEYERMRAPFMTGAFPFPVKYGYAIVGLVEAGAAEWLGHLVFVLHPHQSLFIAPIHALTLLPSFVPSARAVLAANMETALNAVWDAAPVAADRIAIVGAGVVGSLVAWLCGQLPGAETTLIDIEHSREALARSLGVRFAEPGSAPRDCDLVVHASGTAAGLALALGLAGDEATVLELSWHGAGDIAVPLGGAFHSRRLKLISSQVGRVAPSHRARWSTSRRLAAALDLLADRRLDALLAPAIGFHDLPLRLPDILAPPGGILCQLVSYPEA